jgi:hypothetical protein
MKKLRIFLASPSDIQEERNIVSIVVGELQRTIGDMLQVDLELVRWETHTWPDVGDDAQDVINREISDYDVLVGIMWKRFGTPTKRAQSGTGEEFERAYEYFRAYNRPKIMFYFRTTPFYTKDSKEWSQFGKVIRFRKKLEKLGIYFWEYNEPLEFERRVREHLIKQVRELAQKPEEKVAAPKLFLSYVREDIQRVEPIYESLKAAGFAPWIDVKDIHPGQSWVAAIDKAIHDADFFVAFISRNIFNKGFIHKEIQIALEIYKRQPRIGIYLIPVRLEPVEPPVPFMEFQWIDVFSPDDYEELISAIRSVWEKRKS